MSKSPISEGFDSEVTLPSCQHCDRGFLTDNQCKSHEARCSENENNGEN